MCERKIFQKDEKSQGIFKFVVVSLRSSDFLHSQSHIQLSVTIVKFYHFVYHPVLCSYYQTQFSFALKPNLGDLSI